jgi:Tol biopolymer transport system component
MNWLGPVLAAGLSAGPAAAAGDPCTLDRATGTTIDVQPFVKNAYGARWNLATGRIAFMERGPDGWYRVFTVKADGTDRIDLPQVTGKHQGSPYWHPSGRYLLFIAEKKEWSSPALFGNPDYEALPGFGLHDDIWLATPDGKRVWKLTDEPNTKRQGVLLPVFSPDGARVAWAERQPDKTYQIRVADFVETPQPHLRNIKSYLPGGRAYYEPGSFTSDSRSLVYTSDQDTHNFWRSQIYRLDLPAGTCARLTVGNDYNEHPTVVNTPTGDWVVYMSTRGASRLPFHLFLGTDWYAMKTDGSGVKRLTTMSARAKDNPEHSDTLAVACTVAIGPKGDFFLGDVQDDLKKQTGLVKVVHLTCQ